MMVGIVKPLTEMAAPVEDNTGGCVDDEAHLASTISTLGIFG